MCVARNDGGVWYPMGNVTGKEILSSPYPLVGMWVVRLVVVGSRIRHSIRTTRVDGVYSSLNSLPPPVSCEVQR